MPETHHRPRRCYAAVSCHSTEDRRSKMKDCMHALKYLRAVRVSMKGYFRRSTSRREGKQKVVWAHRLVYEECFGPIPEGHVVMHTCDNPSCVNPEHLRCGTPAQNWRDMMSKGRGRWLHGEEHPRSKLTNLQVERILKTPRIRGSGRKLAEELGVSVQQVSSIRCGHYWRNHARRARAVSPPEPPASP